MKKQLIIILMIIMVFNTTTVFGSDDNKIISYNLQQIYPSHELYDEYETLKRERDNILYMGIDRDWKFKTFRNSMKINNEDMLRFIKFNNKEELLKLIDDFEEISSGLGNFKVGEREFSYYIGDPNGTIYSQEEEAKAIRNDKFYYSDIDEKGNVLMYLWEGNKSLVEMSYVDFFNVLELKYAMTIVFMDDYYYSYSDYIKLIGIPSESLEPAHGIFYKTIGLIKYYFIEEKNILETMIFIIYICIITICIIIPILSIIVTIFQFLIKIIFFNKEEEDNTDKETPNNEDQADEE